MKRNLIILLTVSLLLGSCAALNQLAAFAKCEFELEKIEDVKLASIDVKKAKSLTDLGFADIARLTQALLTKELLLEMTAIVKIKNPNAQQAALTRTDWILYIDNVEITAGTTTQRIEIPAQQSAYLPMYTRFNLAELFSGESKTTMYRLAKNISGTGDQPSNIQLKLKPTLSIAGIEMPYPSWITLNRKIGDNKVNN